MASLFPAAPVGIPYITASQMREVDRAMIDDFGITLLQMMENAGRNLAEVTIHRALNGVARGKKVLVAAGLGGNGGGALAAARHLENRGTEVEVILAADGESTVTEAVRHQLFTLRQTEISVTNYSDLNVLSENMSEFDAILDGLVGYSLADAPREPVASIIRLINETDVTVISNDIPSGVDATSGEVYSPAICATATVTIALPKTGFQNVEAMRQSGDIFLSDISVPGKLYERALNIYLPEIFAAGPLLQLS